MKLLNEAKTIHLFKDNEELCAQIILKELRSRETEHS